MQGRSARPTGRGRATTVVQPGTSSSGSRNAQLPPTHLPNGEPVPIGEQLMQVDQAITLALQEIDANFAQTHQIITARILPAIKRYGQASHSTWQGARFWHHFFETASDIRLAPSRGDEWQEQEENSAAETTAQTEDDVGAMDDQTEAEDGNHSPRPHHDAVGSSSSLSSSPPPPRMSDVSLAATARLASTTALRGAEAERTAVPSISRPVHREKDTLQRTTSTSSTPRTARHSALAKDVLRAQHKSALGKLHATPRRGGEAKNPFTSRPVDNVQQQQHGGSWNGIADLRKTPLAASKQKREEERGRSEDQAGDDSLPWPPGMSPPVTMQFSVPRSRYMKTPAKEAAKMVVDDLLRTVEGTNSVARKRLLREREQSTKANPLAPDASSGNPSGLVGTPLRKSSARRPRTSMPTPPTITKRVPAEATSRLGSRQGQSSTNASGSAASSARLLDEGEGREDSMILEEDLPTDLGTGLSKLAISQASSSLDVMFDSSRAGDEDSDSDDFDSESDDEAPDVPISSSSAILPAGYPSSATRHGSWQGTGRAGADPATTGASSSISHSIDEDTLFGIRDPARRRTSSASKQPRHSRIAARTSPAVGRAGARQRASDVNGSNADSHKHTSLKTRDTVAVPPKSRTSNTPGQSRRSVSTSTKLTLGASAANRTPASSAVSFQPLGRIAALGTVHRGRPLLGTNEGEDDDASKRARGTGFHEDVTYSAPSPTPLGTTMRKR